MDNEFKKIIAAVLHISPDFDEVERDKCPIWDSMKHAEIIIKVQKVYGVKFDLTEILEIKRVSEFYNLIQKNPKAKFKPN